MYVVHSQLGFFFFCVVERRQTPTTNKINTMTMIPPTAPTIARISIKSPVRYRKPTLQHTHIHVYVAFWTVRGLNGQGGGVVNGPFTLTFWHQRDFDRVGSVVVGSRAVVYAELLVSRVPDDQRAFNAIIHRVFQYLQKAHAGL